MKSLKVERKSENTKRSMVRNYWNVRSFPLLKRRTSPGPWNIFFAARKPGVKFFITPLCSAFFMRVFQCFNPFHATGHFLYFCILLYFWFSDVFRDYWRRQRYEIDKKKLQKFLKGIYDVFITFQGLAIFFKVLQSPSIKFVLNARFL